jgi:hypothetical protein
MPDMIQIMDQGNRGYGDSERDSTDRQFLEIMEQTGFHGSRFESLTELARARWRSFRVGRAERGGSGDGSSASASKGQV